MPCILIVDDDVVTTKLLSCIAESEGHEVVHAENGLVALESIEKFHFDLILTDIQMPGMDGLALLNKLKERTETSSIPVIAITASYMGNDDREFYLESGFSEYIFKPVYVADLKNIIRRHLGSPDV